jgi:hypothetical protein
MNINIYFEERPRVLHRGLVTIENCQHMQYVINVPNKLNDIKSHVISHRFELQGNQGVSYPVFMSKPSTQRMYDPGSIVPHIWSKVLTDN